MNFQAIAPAILPMLLYLVLQVPVAIIGTLVIREREIGWSEILESWIMGQMITFAVLQVMVIPMVMLRCQFKLLFWSYLGVIVFAFGFGCWGLRGREIKKHVHKNQWTWLSIALVVVTFILILWQSGNYFFGMHLDEDDARWLAEANDALVYGDMYTRNFDTGDFAGNIFYIKDATSPWSMMYAVLSNILQTRTAIFAHTIYAPLELLMMYGIFWLIANELFEKLEAKQSFMLSASIINLFCAGTTYTQSVFSLVRIWQGKATVAAIIIPLLTYLFICIHKRDELADWIKVIIVGCAACLMSGMGILIAAIMIGVYGIYDIFAYQRWKRIPYEVLSLIPSVGFYLINSYWKR